MAAIDAILFDLDDTLLGNNMDVFLQNYFPLLASHVQPVLDTDRFLPELLHATQAMINNKDPEQTNRDVFWRVFCERNGLSQEDTEPFFAAFYEEQFGRLRSTTQRRPVAAEVLRWCFERGFKVAIATNPLFPQSAIEQRLLWAGVGVDDFDYDLVTSYENMHSAKPHEAYYREILSALDVEPIRALMVGDDWKNDIMPATRLGLRTFWIPATAAGDAVGGDSASKATPESPPRPVPDGQGSLEELFEKLKSGWLRG